MFKKCVFYVVKSSAGARREKKFAVFVPVRFIRRSVYRNTSDRAQFVIYRLISTPRVGV